MKYAILTHSGGHYWIDEQMQLNLVDMGLDDMLLTIEGASLKVSTIAEVLPESEYYKQYPEKKSQNVGQPFSNKDSDMQLMLSDPMERARIMQLKAEIDRYKAEAKSPGDLENYGNPLMSTENWEKFIKQNSWFAQKIKARKKDPLVRTFSPENGYVSNPLLGIVHWSMVKYAMDKNFIKRHSGNNWFVIVDQDPVSNKTSAKRYQDFKFKLEAIKYL